MNCIETLAETSVARGCGFAGLAIVVLMLGLSWDLALATQVGGVLALLASLVLLVKARSARRRPHDRTELWIMLEYSERPPSAIAQAVVGRALERWYLFFALHAAMTAASLLAVSLLCSIALGPPHEFWVD